ncbi:MAG: DcaP family trimeric outer membrane transporter, partial [Gammaproteobacteria bacterium]
TSLKIGGYIQTSLIYDIGPRPTSRGGDIASARSAVLEDTPEYENRGDTRFTARNSRFNIATLTPTRFGRIHTFIEADFNGPPNNKGSRGTTSRTAFGLRHAYAEIGNILFGHYWSNFSNNSVFPNKVDGTGPAGRNFMRQGQLRYTHRFEQGGRFAIALENPRGDFLNADDINLADSYPDLTTHYRYETDRWHIQFSGMLRRMGIDEGIPDGASDHVTAWGMNQSGAFLLPESKDRISWYFALGNGIGRYLEGGVEQGASITADGTLNTQFGYGGFVTYRRWWTDTLQSNIDFGFSRFDLNPEENTTANRRLLSSHINLMWVPLDNMEFGIEYVWAHRRVHDGREGSINRINALSVFFF